MILVFDRMVVGFTTTYAIGAYHHWSNNFESHSWLTTVTYNRLVDSLGTPISSSNKTDRHDIAEILLKVELTITLTLACSWVKQKLS